LLGMQYIYDISRSRQTLKHATTCLRQACRISTRVAYQQEGLVVRVGREVERLGEVELPVVDRGGRRRRRGDGGGSTGDSSCQLVVAGVPGKRRPLMLTVSKLLQWPHRTVTVLNKLLVGTLTCTKAHLQACKIFWDLNKMDSCICMKV
jgi:hypothetical protein